MGSCLSQFCESVIADCFYSCTKCSVTDMKKISNICHHEGEVTIKARGKFFSCSRFFNPRGLQFQGLTRSPPSERLVMAKLDKVGPVSIQVHPCHLLQQKTVKCFYAQIQSYHDQSIILGIQLMQRHALAFENKANSVATTIYQEFPLHITWHYISKKR